MQHQLINFVLLLLQTSVRQPLVSSSNLWSSQQGCNDTLCYEDTWCTVIITCGTTYSFTACWVKLQQPPFSGRQASMEQCIGTRHVQQTGSNCILVLVQGRSLEDHLPSCTLPSVCVVFPQLCPVGPAHPLLSPHAAPLTFILDMSLIVVFFWKVNGVPRFF